MGPKLKNTPIEYFLICVDLQSGQSDVILPSIINLLRGGLGGGGRFFTLQYCLVFSC